jgi:hypothetical protein
MSALILASHVKDGVDLARQEKLPQIIVDGIREHHGTTVMAYFYQKAVQADAHASVNRDDFRYPGPRPRSKEAALLMCADAVEAAVRSLKDPTPAQVRAMVTTLGRPARRTASLTTAVSHHDSVSRTSWCPLTTVYRRVRTRQETAPGTEAEDADEVSRTGTEEPARWTRPGGRVARGGRAKDAAPPSTRDRRRPRSGA